MVINNNLILCWGTGKSGGTIQFAIAYNKIYAVIHTANDVNPEDGGIIASTYTSLTKSSCYFWTCYNNRVLPYNLVTYMIIGI